MGQNNEPKTFQEAWYHNDQEKRKKWRTVIRKEFQDMIKRGVWVNVNRSSILEGRKLIGSKWVFVTEEIKNVFSVTVSPEATEYLGCKMHVAKNNTCSWIGQPHLYKNLE